MTAALPTDAELAKLRAIDTPTICNALELIAPQRRGYGYTTRPLVCARPEMGAIVGYARTATIRAMLAPEEPPAAVRARRIDYYRYVDTGPKPTVIVMQDLDPSPGFGAFWGEVNTNVHLGLGALGVVTDGSIRDLDQCAAGFQMLAGMVGPSHAWVRIEGFGLTVTVAGMTVRHDDLIHADRHGAVVVPYDAVAKITAAVDLLVRREAVIIGASRRPGFTAEVLAQAMKDADDIH